MKKFNVFIIAMLTMFALAFQVNAQYTEWNENAYSQSSDTYKTVYFEATVSGTDTLISNEFNFTGYNPGVFCAKLLNADSSTAKPKLTILRSYSFFPGATPTFVTLYTSDSLETQVTFADTLRGNNKLYFIGTGTNPNDTKVKLLYIAEPK